MCLGNLNLTMTPNVTCLGSVSLFIASFLHQCTLFGFFTTDLTDFSMSLICFCLKCPPPWSRFLAYRLGDTLSKGKFSSLSRKRLSHFYENNTCLSSRRLAMDAVVVIQLPQIVFYLGIAHIRFCWIPFLTQRPLAVLVSAGTCPIISRCLAVDVSVVSRFNNPAFRHCLSSVAQQWSLTSRCLAMDVL
jgi:hypothetical protein